MNLSRRNVAAGLAAAVTAVPAVGLCSIPRMPNLREDRIIEILKRYQAGCDALNATCKVRGLSDGELDAIVDRNDKTLAEVVGLPALTAAGALAALDFVIAEQMEELAPDVFPFDGIIASLLDTVRGYIASTAR